MAHDYTVVPGDTLWAISTRFYGRGELFPVIADANRLPNPDLIFPGQVLHIPDLAPPPPPTPPPPPDQPPPPVEPEGPPDPVDFHLLRPADLLDLHCTAVGFKVEVPGSPQALPSVPTEVRHTVVPGDTLWDIAGRFYGDPRRYPEIVAANGIGNPDLIFPGQVFLIPGIAGPPGPAPAIPVVDPTRHLRAVTDDAHIVVRFGPQNVFEVAADTVTPTRILAAKESRVVFQVPSGTRIEFTTVGILRVLPLLKLAVSPSATPRPDPADIPVEVPDEPAQLTDRDTAIEAPFRLVVSPSSRGAFTHSAEPVAAPGDPHRIELWTTRLAVRREVDGQLVGIDRIDQTQRIVRALHTRNDQAPPEAEPTGSLTSAHRRNIVELTSHRVDGVEPEPLSVRTFALSAVGAWIDWSASWAATAANKLLAYRHLAPMGRDAYVRVDEPGLLYPFGHRAMRVIITERQIAPGPDPVARLIKRMFIVVREPARTYTGKASSAPFAMPFTDLALRPLVTPDIRLDTGPRPFVAEIEGVGSFRWRVTGTDHAGRAIAIETPLVFVPLLDVDTDREFAALMTPAAEKWNDVRSELTVLDKSVAMAPSSTAGDTTFQVEGLTFAADFDATDQFVAPRVEQSQLVIPALSALNGGNAPVSVEYEPQFRAQGFSGPAEVFLTLTGPQVLDFGGNSSESGGFVQPNVTVAAISRTLGAIGDKDVAAGSPLAAGTFDPAAFLGNAGPKLFGMFGLLELIADGTGLERAPELVSEALDVVSGLRSEHQRLTVALDGLSAQVNAEIVKATHGGATAQLQTLLGDVDRVRGQIVGAADRLADAFDGVLTGVDGSVATAVAEAAVLAGVLDQVQGLVANPALPAAARSLIERPAIALRQITAVATDPRLAAVLTSLRTGVVRFEWQPELEPWPVGSDENNAVFLPSRQGLTISVEVRAGDQPRADVSAQLTDFTLALLPGARLISMRFRRIGFRTSTGRKPEIDVVFDGMKFEGPLEFIEKLREVIPFDGFSDPPFVDVSTSGVKAGFELALPSIPLGIFSLENIALYADCHVPFLDQAVTVGFGFCKKESPFRLTVMAIGGGGWVGIRLSPKGLVLLEMGLEAGAALSLDFGVASGSVSVMIGIYLRLEGDEGTLTAYFRIRGEVDVLGLASASLTLELSLTYDTATGKLVGRASLVIEVEVLFFSASVEVTVERRLAGSKGDPSLRDIMPPDSGGDVMWDNYFGAFALGA